MQKAMSENAALQIGAELAREAKIVARAAPGH
jgi:hypothetical protein